MSDHINGRCTQRMSRYLPTQRRIMTELPSPNGPGRTICVHPNVPPVPFDAEAAKALDAYEVRRRWPRLIQTCPDCGATDIICYASSLHYYLGDW